VTPLPAWAHADWTRNVAEPFRSNGEFWSSLAASADALTSLLIAAITAVALVLSGEPAWSFVPFAVPTVLVIRAGLLSRSSSRHTREAFADRPAWRAAERHAVAIAFVKVLRRPRGSQ
jgi:hypothetical protein